MMYAVIYIRDFALQAACRHDNPGRGGAVVLVDDQVQKARIVQVNERARQAGIRPGMTSTQALARESGVTVKLRSREQEQHAAQTVLQSLFEFSPYVETTAPGVWTLDLRGQSWAGRDDAGELERFAEALRTTTAMFHLRANVGLAAHPLIAWQAARIAEKPLLLKEPRTFVARQAIEFLEPSEGVARLLAKWGIGTVGEFLKLGREAVAERLGEEGMHLWERAAPGEAQPLRLAVWPETFEEAIEWEHEVEVLEPLLFVLRRFLVQLSQRLALGNRVAREQQVGVRLVDGTTVERSLSMPAPTRDVDRLFGVLQTWLESVRTEQPVRGIFLRLLPDQARQEQLGLFEPTLRNVHQFYEMLGRISAILGADRVGMPVLEESHRPDAIRMERVQVEQQVRGEKKAEVESVGRRRIRMRVRVGLPLRRYRPRLPVAVVMQGGHPGQVRGNEVKGVVRKAQGPWRTSGEWWDAKRWAHEEWDVELAGGGLYRLSRDEAGWFVEGMYD